MARQVPPVCEHSFASAVRASCVRLTRGRARASHELFSQWRRCSHKLSNCVSPGRSRPVGSDVSSHLDPSGSRPAGRRLGRIKGRGQDRAEILISCRQSQIPSGNEGIFCAEVCSTDLIDQPHWVDPVVQALKQAAGSKVAFLFVRPLLARGWKCEFLDSDTFKIFSNTF